MVFFAPPSREQIQKYKKHLKSVSKKPEKKKLQDTSVWQLSADDVSKIVYGAPAFAGGGGGAKQWGYLFMNLCIQIVGQGNPICDCVDISQLNDDDVIVPIACMGRPDYLQVESDYLGQLVQTAIDTWNKTSGTPMKYVCGVEVGGTNSIVPMYACCAEKAVGNYVQLVDMDLQGRAVLRLFQLGPYMYNLTMAGTCAAYFAKQGQKIPKNAVVTRTIAHGDQAFPIVGVTVPDTSISALDGEAFLSNIIANAQPETVIAVAFGGLKKKDLMTQGTKYTSGTYTPICVPNTIKRSRDMGISLHGALAPTQFVPLQEQGAVLFMTGTMGNMTASSGGGTRGDAGTWIVTDSTGKVLQGIYVNENVVLTNADQTIAYTTAPNGIAIQANADYPNFSVLRGECFSNDELWAIQQAAGGTMPAMAVNVFAMPPAPLTISYEGLKMIGPSQWSIEQYFSPVPPVANGLSYVPSLSQFAAPSYRILPTPPSLSLEDKHRHPKRRREPDVDSDSHKKRRTK